jgi:hypothetical protein
MPRVECLKALPSQAHVAMQAAPDMGCIPILSPSIYLFGGLGKNPTMRGGNPLVAERSKGRADLCRKELRLFPRRQGAAFVHLTPKFKADRVLPLGSDFALNLSADKVLLNDML